MSAKSLVVVIGALCALGSSVTMTAAATPTPTEP